MLFGFSLFPCGFLPYLLWFCTLFFNSLICSQCTKTLFSGCFAPFYLVLRSMWLLLLAGHSLGVVAVAAHPAGTIAASTSLDSFVRVFDIDTNATVATLETPPSEAWLMQFDPKVCLLNVMF